MKAIILAAGEGKRMRPLTKECPKCLLPYKDTTPIQRMIAQLRKQGVSEIVIVTCFKAESLTQKLFEPGITFIKKTKYTKNANRYSMFVALEYLKDSTEDIVVFEADMIAEDEFIRYVVGTDFENKTVWFTNGEFKKGKHGGILRSGKNVVKDIRYVKRYSPRYKNYDKLTGVMRISWRDIPLLYNSLKEYGEKHSFYGYYLKPWGESKIKMFKGDASHYIFNTYNTIGEYKKACDTIYETAPVKRKLCLMPIEDLLPIEKFDIRRLKKIDSIKEGNWTDPLRIEKNYNLILDGHHRYHKAKSLGLKRLPVIRFDYDEVDMWSLREELSITKSDVIKNAMKGKLYPKKTVKHKFPVTNVRCNIPLENLR
jgi:choline kinase